MKYLFLTVCSKEKNPKSFEQPMPLGEMYIGQVYNKRIELLKCITDEVYITSLLELGIVKDTYIGMGYEADPILLKQKDFNEFCENHRKLFEKRYPGRLDEVEKVFFLGEGLYDNYIKQIFYDKDVVICIKNKLTVGLLRSWINKMISYFKPPKNMKLRHYLYKGWLFEFNGTFCTLYEQKGDEYYEINGLSFEMNFIKKFRELTGNLTTKEYCDAVGVSKGKRYELLHPTIEKYFKNVLNITPTIEKNLIKYDYFNSGMFDEEFVKVLKESLSTKSHI